MKANFYSLLQINSKEQISDELSSDFVFVIGVMPSRQDGLLEQLSKNTTIVYLSVIEDRDMLNIAKFQSRYEAGSEEGVLAILAKELLKNKNLDANTQEFFDNLDEGYVSAECNIGEEEIEEIAQLYKNAKNPMIVIGYDLYNHPRAKNIAKLLSLLVKYGNFRIYSQDLNLPTSKEKGKLENIEVLDSFDGSVVYACPSSDVDEQELLIGSKQFMMAAKVKNDDDVFVITNCGEYQRKFKMDEELKGTVALMPSVQGDESYYYKIAKIIKREN
ncbi:MAG: hypothetical protein L3J44_02615 [Campylobacteraceae bacterium]|nr:hypothetical protein [Campylobacteraceae bacterium]